MMWQIMRTCVCVALLSRPLLVPSPDTPLLQCRAHEPLLRNIHSCLVADPELCRAPLNKNEQALLSIRTTANTDHNLLMWYHCTVTLSCSLRCFKSTFEILSIHFLERSFLSRRLAASLTLQKINI